MTQLFKRLRKMTGHRAASIEWYLSQSVDRADFSSREKAVQHGLVRRVF